MKIDQYIDEFLRTQFRRDRDGLETAKTLFKSDKEYALTRTFDYMESDSLEANMRASVQKMVRGKDTAIRVYRKFVQFLQDRGVDAKVSFPPIPVDNALERIMYLAKYFHSPDAKVQDLPDILWVSERTINTDIQNMSGGSSGEAVRILGREFRVPEPERSRGRLHHESTVHPLFLTENLTQILVMFKGLRKMAEDRLYRRYAEATAADIWEQLSDYARNRIRTVLKELLPEDLSWYEGLDEDVYDCFLSERQCSVRDNVWLYCIKNETPFFVEYREDDGIVLYRDCRYIRGTYHAEAGEFRLEVMCDAGRKLLTSDRVLRSCYLVEELAAD